LVEYERYRAAIRATFAPRAWSGLRVRASWWATSRDVVDLEVQVTASSVGELEGLEVGVVSRLGSGVAPHDVQHPSPTSLTALRLFLSPWAAEDVYYAEMAHPDDVAKRVSSEVHGSPGRRPPGHGYSTRHALFGLELEKGVVLRARLRGCWFQSANPEQAAAALYEEFLREPPPLGP
jgi:hypothetical protein